MTTPINILTLQAHGEHWVFLYTPATKSDLLRTLGRFWTDPRLSFDHRDARRLAKEIRQGVIR